MSDTQTCPACGETKPISSFYVVKKKLADHSYHWYRWRVCKQCGNKKHYQSEKEKLAEQREKVFQQIRNLILRFGPISCACIARKLGRTNQSVASLLGITEQFVKTRIEGRRAVLWDIDYDVPQPLPKPAASPKPATSPKPKVTHIYKIDPPDDWYVALQAEVAARKAALVAMRGRV